MSIIRPPFPPLDRDHVRNLLHVGFTEPRIRIEQAYTGRTYALDAYMPDALVPQPPHEEKNNRWGPEGQVCVGVC